MFAVSVMFAGVILLSGTVVVCWLI